MKSLTAIYKKILEQKLAEKEIAWVRKDGGLQLAIFGKPVIQIYEEAIRIGLICDTGFHGSKCYQYLEIKHGDVSRPGCDPESTIDKILSIADAINTLMDQATNKEDVEKFRRVKLPASTAQKAVKEGFAARGINVSTSITRGTVIADNGQYKWHIREIERDGSGNVWAESSTLDEILDACCEKYKSAK